MEIWKRPRNGKRWEKERFVPFPNKTSLCAIVEKQCKRKDFHYIVFSIFETQRLKEIMGPIYSSGSRIPVAELVMILGFFKMSTTKPPFATTVGEDTSLTIGHPRQTYRLAIAINHPNP